MPFFTIEFQLRLECRIIAEYCASKGQPDGLPHMMVDTPEHRTHRPINIELEKGDMAEYAHPESLVSTDWVAEHGSDVNVKVVKVDVDTSAYDSGHIAGAGGWDWQSQL